MSYCDASHNGSPILNFGIENVSSRIDSSKLVDSSKLYHSIRHIDGFDVSAQGDDNSRPTIEFSNVSISRNVPENCSNSHCVDDKFTEEFLPENKIQFSARSVDNLQQLSIPHDVPVRKNSRNYEIDESTSHQNESFLPGPNVPNNFLSSVIENNPSNITHPIIDSRMSDVLLLAIYKGFQTPQLQAYMNTLEESILSHLKKCGSHQIHSQFDSNILQSNSSPHVETADTVNKNCVYKNPEHLQKNHFPKFESNICDHVSHSKDQVTCDSTHEPENSKTESLFIDHISTNF